MKYRPLSGRLRSLTTLRQALALYLELVIKSLPLRVSTCRTCARPNGSLAIVCFGGLQLGYKLKHKRSLVRTTVRTSAIPLASAYAHIIGDAAVAKALGSVLRVSKHEPGKDKAVTTITSLRGWVMAVRVLWGDPSEPVLTPPTKSKARSPQEKGWDATTDGCVRPEFAHFLRKLFCCGPVARELCIEISAAAADLRRRIPRHLRMRMFRMVADDPDEDDDRAPDDLARAGGPKPAEPPAALNDDAAPAGGSGEQQGRHAVAASLGGAAPSLAKGEDGESTESEASTEVEDSNGELTSADHRISVTGDAVDTGSNEVWDKTALLLHFAELFKERALADTGGAVREQAEKDRLLRLQPSKPTTAAASHKISSFVRAVALVLYTLWAPAGRWDAVDALIATLDSPFYTSMMLTDVLENGAVCDLHHLRDAAACLVPAFAADGTVRAAFSSLLGALKETGGAYDAFVAVSERLHEDSGSGAAAWIGTPPGRRRGHARGQ